MNAPLSLHLAHKLHGHDSIMQFQPFHPHFLHQPRTFQDAFYHQQPQQLILQPQPEAFAPQPGYAAMDESPNNTTSTQAELGIVPSTIIQPPQLSMSGNIGLQALPMAGNPVSSLQGDTCAHKTSRLRFQTTLNAPTAMVRRSDEIPITYLNKCQAYTMSIFDTTPPLLQPNVALKYRTYVRVSFEDEQQRANPGAYWKLWKAGRGLNEAHQRDGKLLAVEYIDPNLLEVDESHKSQVQLETASFDGFDVTWFPVGDPDCSISIRFNFLSTDFSHSKGVKGTLLRLCAKTELLIPQTTASNEPEVCFSKVKLFRDHGAERKLSNDFAHVKKTIGKLKQQIAQAEARLGNARKTTRSGFLSKKSNSRTGKVLKHKRICSLDTEVEGPKFSAEEDLQMELVRMQDMLSSAQPVSVLFLCGEPEDDPNLHLVKLPGDNSEIIEAVRTTTWVSRQSTSDSPTSNTTRPSATSTSRATPKQKHSEMQQSAIQEEPDNYHNNECSVRTSVSASRRVQISKIGVESKSNRFAFDVDSVYQLPTVRTVRPGKFSTSAKNAKLIRLQLHAFMYDKRTLLTSTTVPCMSCSGRSKI
jgi:hypothetical protein